MGRKLRVTTHRHASRAGRSLNSHAAPLPFTMHTFHIYRYDPDAAVKPRMQTLELEVGAGDRMLGCGRG